MTNIELLVRAARLAAVKLKREYDRQEPDAGPNECWAEQERLVEALEAFGPIYSNQRDYPVKAAADESRRITKLIAEYARS